MPPEAHAGSGIDRAGVFVYFRVKVADEAALHAAYARLRSGLTRDSSALPVPPVPPVLMCRDESGRDGAGTAGEGAMRTWMEIWWQAGSSLGDVVALKAAIDAAIADAGVAARVAGERHYEFFVPCV